MHMVSRQVSIDGAATLVSGSERSRPYDYSLTEGLTEVANINEGTLATIIAHALKKVTEQGIDPIVVLTVPLIIFCGLSWSLSLPGAGEWLALIVMSIASSARIIYINRSGAERDRDMESLKVDNDSFRKHVSSLETQNKKFADQNARLEELQKLLALNSIKTDGDLRSCLREFHIILDEQRHLQQEIRRDMDQKRSLVEADKRLVFIKIFQTCCTTRGRETGIRARLFPMFSSMVPGDWKTVLAGLLTFECIDSATRDGVIDMRDMDAWLPKAVQKLVEFDEGTADGDFCHAKLPAQSHIADISFAAGHRAYMSSTQSMASTTESFIIDVDGVDISRESTSRSTCSC